MDLTPERRKALEAERKILLKRCKHLELEIERRAVFAQQTSSTAPGPHANNMCMSAPVLGPFGLDSQAANPVVQHHLFNSFGFASVGGSGITSTNVSPPASRPYVKPVGLEVEDVSLDGENVTHDDGHDDDDSRAFTRSPILFTERPRRLVLDSKALVIIMVGLPGRGKSYISKRLSRWLNWMGVPTRIFNAGHYRRVVHGARETAEADFYDPRNEAASLIREEMAQMAINDLTQHLLDFPGGVGILDATNTTQKRRQRVCEQLKSLGRVLFIESVCTQTNIIHSNILRAKCYTDDYKEVDEAEVLRDFYERISHYEKVYQSLCPQQESALSFIKMTNVKTEVVFHRLKGYLMGHVASFLMNLHICDQPIYLTRSGWSDKGKTGVYGHDDELNDTGLRYAICLAQFLEGQKHKDVVVFSSQMQRARQTVMAAEATSGAAQSFQIREYAELNEMNYGDFAGKTKEQCRRDNPKMFERMMLDPYSYCYPRGEGYRTLCKRLEPVLLDLQQQEVPSLVVTHRAVLKVMQAFLLDRSPEESISPDHDVPLGCVIELSSHKNATLVRRHDLSEMMAAVTQEQLDAVRNQVSSVTSTPSLHPTAPANVLASLGSNNLHNMISSPTPSASSDVPGLKSTAASSVGPGAATTTATVLSGTNSSADSSQDCLTPLPSPVTNMCAAPACAAASPPPSSASNTTKSSSSSSSHDCFSAAHSHHHGHDGCLPHMHPHPTRRQPGGHSSTSAPVAAAVAGCMAGSTPPLPTSLPVPSSSAYAFGDDPFRD
eukprot:PhM_4_TR18793/c0_g2_i1/m.77462/K01103/PFKFB3; 6-phosphofructo-2-kinase / fructose-2,6-biphosphatase 3&\